MVRRLILLCVFYHNNTNGNGEERELIHWEEIFKRKRTVDNLREIRESIMSEEQECGSLTFLVGCNYMHLSHMQAHTCNLPTPHTQMHTTSVASTLIVVPTSQGDLGLAVSSPANGDQGSPGCSESTRSGPGIPNFVLPEGKGSCHVGAILVFQRKPRPDQTPGTLRSPLATFLSSITRCIDSSRYIVLDPN